MVNRIKKEATKAVEVDLDEDDYDDEELDEPAEPQWSKEQLDEAKKQRAAIKNGVDVKEIANFISWVPDLLEAIALGVFDGPLLKSIVAECFARRDAVMPLIEKQAARASGTAEAATKVAHAPFAGAILGEGGLVLRPARHAPRVFAWEGRSYSKDDMIGKYVVTPKDMERWYYGKILSRIVGVGTANLRIEFVVDPKAVHPSSSILKAKGIGIGFTITVPAEHFPNIFGV